MKTILTTSASKKWKFDETQNKPQETNQIHILPHTPQVPCHRIKYVNIMLCVVKHNGKLPGKTKKKMDKKAKNE